MALYKCLKNDKTIKWSYLNFGGRMSTSGNFAVHLARNIDLTNYKNFKIGSITLNGFSGYVLNITSADWSHSYADYRNLPSIDIDLTNINGLCNIVLQQNGSSANAQGSIILENVELSTNLKNL